MYLNLVQLAESFGVSEKVVEDWIRDEGLPKFSDRGRLLFDRAQVAQWAAERGLAAQAGFLAPPPSAPSAAGGCNLEPLLRTGGIWRDIAPGALADTIEAIVCALPGATPPVKKLIAQRLRADGGITWAPVGGGLALPHPSVRVALGRDSGTVALIMLREATTQIAAPDDVPVTRLFFFLAPSPRAHLELLGKLSRALARGRLRDLALQAAPDSDILAATAEADAAAAAKAAAAAAAAAQNPPQA